MINAIDNNLIKDPSEATMLAVDIDNAREKYKGQEGYLNKIKLPYR